MAVFFLLMALVIGISLLVGCSAPVVTPTPTEQTYPTQMAYIQTVRANEPRITSSSADTEKIALIVATCDVVSRITDMPADVGMFNQVYCP